MGSSVSARNRVLVVLAFLVSAALFAGAAVAFVMARNDDDDKKPVGALPSIRPTLVYPSQQPTAEPTQAPTTAPTVAPTTPAPTASASPTPAATGTPAATSSPTPRRTPTAKPSPTQAVTQGLSSTASLNFASGATTADLFKIVAKATDGNGSISLQSLDWGDGSALIKGGRGTACTPPATAPADCRNFSWTHTYAQAGHYIITIAFVSGKETSILHLTADVDPAPSPAPTTS